MGEWNVEGKKAFMKLVKICVKVTVSSVQNGIYSLEKRKKKKRPSALHPVSETFPRCCH